MSKAFCEIPPLRVDPRLKAALDTYCKQLGVPRAKVLRQIIRTFLGPMAQNLGEASDDLADLAPQEESSTP